MAYWFSQGVYAKASSKYTTSTTLDFSHIINTGLFNNTYVKLNSIFVRATKTDITVGDLYVTVNGKRYRASVNKFFPVGADREVVFMGSDSQIDFSLTGYYADLSIDTSGYDGLVISDWEVARIKCSMQFDKELLGSHTGFSVSQTNLLKEFVVTSTKTPTWNVSTYAEIKTSSQYYRSANDVAGANYATIYPPTFTTGGTYTVKVGSFFTDWFINESNNRMYFNGSYEKSVQFSYTLPTVTSLNISHTNIGTQTYVTWTGNDYNKYTIDVISGGSVIHSYTGYGASTSYNIPVGVITNEQQTEVKLTLAWNDTPGNPSSKTFSPKFIYPTVTNLSQIGNLWEREITINWRSDNQQGYEYELFQNNTSIKTGGGSSEKTFTIPARTYTNKDNATCRVRTWYMNAGNNKTYSNWSEISLSLQDITATISNLLVNGNEWENPIALSWLSDNQEQYKVEVLKNNVVVKTYTGATAKAHTIPANELSEGVHTFKVWVAYQSRFVNSQSREVTLKNIIPTVDQVMLSGSNIDLPLTLSWTSTNQQNYEVEIYKDSTKVKTYTGTTGTSVNIPAATLATGVHIFKVRVAYSGRWSDWKQTQSTLSETLPSIGILEPDGRIVDRDTAIRVYWTSQNQTKWSLLAGGTTYTGTSELEQVLPIGALPTGRQSITLMVTLEIAGKVKTTSKTVEFIVQGKPPMPTITSGSEFANNRPIITWDSADCSAYRLEVLGVYDSGWINGLSSSHKLRTYLANGSYTVKLTVKNQYAIDSDAAYKEITVNATSEQTITARITNNALSNTIAWDNTTFLVYYIFRNGDMIGRTSATIFYDHTCTGDNTYFVRGITSTDIIVDSNTLYTQNDIEYPTLSIGSNMLEMIYSQSQERLSANYSSMGQKVFVSGRKSPITRHGEQEDMSYSFDYAEMQEDNFMTLLDMIKAKVPILYRSDTVKAWLSFDGCSLNDNKSYMLYSVTGYVVDYDEGVTYE